MSILVGLVSLIVTLVVFIYILLFGQSTYHRNGIVGSMNRFLTTRLPALIGIWAKKIFGKRAFRMWKSIETYCFFSRNPMLQIFYGLLVGGGYIIFLYTAFPRLPVHHQVASFVVVSLTVVAFLLACYTDPGRITKDNLERYLPNYPYDGIMYMPKTCRTCLIERPARSKHCPLCDRCVARYDHHCPWLNTCVGARNIRWFHAFLWGTIIMCMYGTYLMGHIIWYDTIVRHDMISLLYRNPPPPYGMLLQFVLYYSGTGVFGLSMMCFFAGIAVCFFLLYHVYLVWRNTTTQESIKWSWLSRLYKDQKPIRQELRSRMQAGEKYDKIIEALKQVEDFDEDDLTLISEPINIYRRNIFQNFMEVIFPLCDRSDHALKVNPSLLEKIKKRDQDHSDLQLASQKFQPATLKQE